MARIYFIAETLASAEALAARVAPTLGFGAASFRAHLVTQFPSMQNEEAFLESVPGERRESVERHLHQTQSRYEQTVREMLPDSPPAECQSEEFVALIEAWKTEAPGSIALHRTYRDGAVLAVFAGWSVSPEGSVAHAPGAEPLVPPILITENVPKNLVDSIADIINYVGFGLTLAGFPGLGTIISGLISVLMKWLDPAFSETNQIISAVQKLLRQNRIQTEIDFAQSEINTWMDFRTTYFKAKDLDFLVAPKSDPNSAEYKDCVDRLEHFISKTTADFEGTPRLFDAVNLMMVRPPGINSAKLDEPTDAMYKFSAFLFFANFVLVFGKDAMLAQLTIHGQKSTRDLAEAFAAKSQIYATYAEQLLESVHKQVETRLSKVVVDSASSGGEVFLWDEMSQTARDGMSPIVRQFDYCGAGEKQGAIDKANALVPGYKQAVEDAIYAKFFNGGAARLNSVVASMLDANKKIQAVPKQTGG